MRRCPRRLIGGQRAAARIPCEFCGSVRSRICGFPNVSWDRLGTAAFYRRSMVEIFGIKLTHHPAGVSVLADIEYAPVIKLNGFVWLLVFPATVFLAGVVIFIFTIAVAAFGDVVNKGKNPLEIVGLIAIGIAIAYVFYYVLRWVLGHAESGWGALGLAFFVALFASLSVIVYAWLRNSNYYFTVLGSVVVAAISWTGFQHDRDIRPAMDEPHRCPIREMLRVQGCCDLGTFN